MPESPLAIFFRHSTFSRSTPIGSTCTFTLACRNWAIADSVFSQDIRSSSDEQPGAPSTIRMTRRSFNPVKTGGAASSFRMASAMGLEFDNEVHPICGGAGVQSVIAWSIGKEALGMGYSTEPVQQDVVLRLVIQGLLVGLDGLGDGPVLVRPDLADVVE